MNAIPRTPEAVRSPRRAGFTYLELVICVLLVGILAAAAAPRYADALCQSQAKSAALRIQSDLAFARRSAIARSQSVNVKFGADGKTYSLDGLTSLNHPGQPYLIDLSQYPYRATVASAALGGDTSVLFNLHGRPDSGGVITVRSGGRQQTVTVNAESGKATVP